MNGDNNKGHVNADENATLEVDLLGLTGDGAANAEPAADVGALLDEAKAEIEAEAVADSLPAAAAETAEGGDSDPQTQAWMDEAAALEKEIAEFGDPRAETQRLTALSHQLLKEKDAYLEEWEVKLSKVVALRNAAQEKQQADLEVLRLKRKRLETLKLKLDIGGEGEPAQG